MVRPNKTADTIRSQTARCRLSVPEKEQVRLNAASVGMTDTDFIRDRILNIPLPPARSGSDPALIAALNNYALALSKIGNNLNQLAAATHQGRDFTKYWREIGDETQVDLVKVRNALNAALEGLAE